MNQSLRFGLKQPARAAMRSDRNACCRVILGHLQNRPPPKTFGSIWWRSVMPRGLAVLTSADWTDSERDMAMLTV
jgi:hypothetical protein